MGIFNNLFGSSKSSPKRSPRRTDAFISQCRICKSFSESEDGELDDSVCPVCGKRSPSSVWHCLRCHNTFCSSCGGDVKCPKCGISDTIVFQ